MRRLVTVAAQLSILIFVATSASAEPYAEKVKAPDDDGMAAREYKAIVVPERAAVPIPPYPGARVNGGSTTMSGFQGDNKMVKCIPFVSLLTTDPPDKVTDFYKGALKGYKFKDNVLYRLFWSGRDNLEMLSPGWCLTPSVSVTAAHPEISGKLMPEAKTLIQIYYNPK